MGSRGGNAPNPYAQHQAFTQFLRVPFIDWPRVKIGEKTEFRTKPRESSRILRANTPTPVVAYAINGSGEYDRKLMVLEEHRYEPLFAISDDSEAIAREGFETYDHFRRYWRKRRKGVYRPMERVHVWRVRRFHLGTDPFEADDESTLGVALFEHLYGDYLD